MGSAMCIRDRLNSYKKKSIFKRQQRYARKAIVEAEQNEVKHLEALQRLVTVKKQDPIANGVGTSKCTEDGETDKIDISNEVSCYSPSCEGSATCYSPSCSESASCYSPSCDGDSSCYSPSCEHRSIMEVEDAMETLENKMSSLNEDGGAHSCEDQTEEALEETTILEGEIVNTETEQKRVEDIVIELKVDQSDNNTENVYDVEEEVLKERISETANQKDKEQVKEDQVDVKQEHTITDNGEENNDDKQESEGKVVKIGNTGWFDADIKKKIQPTKTGWVLDG